MKKTILYIVLAALCLNFQARAQDLIHSGGLKIGDKASNITIANIINYQTKTARISDFKGKLLILDFWATWCSPCVAMMPKIDELQKYFNGRVQFLSVTNQDQQTLKSFFNNYKKKINTDIAIPAVTNDKLLNSLFPHTYIPHYVWIDKNGIVRSFTSAYYISKKDILSFLQNNKTEEMAIKNDIDVNKPLFSSPALPLSNLVGFVTFFKGRIEGTGSGTHPRKDARVIGLAWTNITLIDMYSRIADHIIKNFSYKNIAISVKDSSKILLSKSKLSKDEWYRENVYSLDCIIPIKDSADLYPRLLTNTNNYSGYTGLIEKRQVRHFELRLKDTNRNYSSKSPSYQNNLSENGNGDLTHAPISHFIDWLNENFKAWPLVTDATGLHDPIDIHIKKSCNTIYEIKAELNQQGYDLIESYSPVTMLIITDQ